MPLFHTNALTAVVEKSRLGSRSRDFCQIFESLGLGQFGLGKKSLCFSFGKFGLEKKVSISVLEKFGLGKSLGFGFGKFGIGKNVSVSVSVKILVSSFSASKSMH